MQRTQLLALTAGLLVLVGAGLIIWREYGLYGELASLRAERTDLTGALAQEKAHSEELSRALAAEKKRNNAFASQIESIGGTVADLTKLAQTDPELLKKYSRVYFLNENYQPQSLAPIDPAYALEPDRELEVVSQVKPYLEAMLSDAKEAGNPILVASAYRSFNTQANLKSSYRVTYGSGSNAFSADQGYSEHQLGSTVDLVTPEAGALSLAFASTTAGVWLTKHAHEYGFILSYPRGNGYYQYEPWHWRFVGRALASKLYADGEHFYDLPQREIDSYLGELFD